MYISPKCYLMYAMHKRERRYQVRPWCLTWVQDVCMYVHNVHRVDYLVASVLCMCPSCKIT